MKCERCNNEVLPGSSFCSVCGAAVKVGSVPQAPVPPTFPAGGAYAAPQPATNMVLNVPPKSRIAYVLLAIFLGGLGIHNFYAGYMERGVTQLLISVLGGSFTCGISSLVVWVWAIIEACITTTDKNGVPFN